MPHIVKVDDDQSSIQTDGDETTEYEGIEDEEPPVIQKKKLWRPPRAKPPGVKAIKTSEGGALIKVGEILDARAKNWHSWSQSMALLFQVLKVGDYVHGRMIPCPDPQEDPVGAANWEYNDTYAQMLITNNIAPAEKVHTNGAPTAHRMWTNLQAMHESTNRLVLTGYLRPLMTVASEGVNIAKHLGKLKRQWDQLDMFSVYNQQIADTLFKCIIASSLPPSWDNFTDPYVAGQVDEVTTDPKKLINSQQFLGIIRQEAERRLSTRQAQGGATTMYPEQATYAQRPDNPKPPLSNRIAGVSPDTQSRQSSSTRRRCKHCHCEGHKTSKCWFLGKYKCSKCNLFGHGTKKCRTPGPENKRSKQNNARGKGQKGVHNTVN